MPAVSKAQQRFMGMVHAADKGETPASPEVAKVSASMKDSDAKDFASTKHKGLPDHVREAIKEIVRGVIRENSNTISEMSPNDVHFRHIIGMFDKGGSFTKKKVASVVTKNPNSNRNKIIDYLQDMDYSEIIDVEDELRIGESINEIEYKDAVEKFNADLMKNSQVERIAKHHKRSIKDVVKALQPYLKVLRYSDKSIKVISIDFRDTNSDVKVHVSQTYKQNESVNEGLLDIIPYFKKKKEAAEKKQADILKRRQEMAYNNVKQVYDTTISKLQDPKYSQDKDAKIKACDDLIWTVVSGAPKNEKLNWAGLKTSYDWDELNEFGMMDMIESSFGEILKVKTKKNESVNEEHDCGCNENHDCGCGGVHEHTHINEDIKTDINKFLDKLNKEFPEQEYTTDFKGGKYARIVHQNRKYGGGRSAWGFVSMEDNPSKGFKKGDLLKAAGFNTPAKGARGNILDGTARYGKWSPEYLK